MQPLVVFDVESVGLHGEGFAAGAVVVDTETGAVVEEFYSACPPIAANGRDSDRAWIAANVVPVLKDYPAHTTRQVRDEFWSFWRRWAGQGARLASDCGWPVEANFLSACVEDEPGERVWQGPYPLLDLAPMLWLKGHDPTETFDRLATELPSHHPLNDARQTARIITNLYRVTAMRHGDGQAAMGAETPRTRAIEVDWGTRVTVPPMGLVDMASFHCASCQAPLFSFDRHANVFADCGSVSGLCSGCGKPYRLDGITLNGTTDPAILAERMGRATADWPGLKGGSPHGD